MFSIEMKRATPKEAELGDTTAVILAGGMGTRLKPAVTDLPKVLAPVAGRAFLDYLFDQLIASGVTKAVLCTGFLAEKVEQHYGHQYKELILNYSKEESPQGTGGAVRAALSKINSKHLLILNGDSFVDTDLKQFYRWYYDNSYEAALLLVEVDDTSRYGRVVLGNDGEIHGFHEKEGHKHGWINGGIYLVAREKLEELEVVSGDAPLSLERDVFPYWVSEHTLYGFQSQSSRFIDIGTPASYKQAEQFFADEASR